jgi:peptidoglycan/xylan/chitin deacetylase (PgdA/CDA1 family)
MFLPPLLFDIDFNLIKHDIGQAIPAYVSSLWTVDPDGPKITSATTTSTTTVSNTPKLVALTFDDGPYGTSTEKILSILESEHAPATFFLIGKNAEKFPDLVKRMYADHDDVGNHSYGHSRGLADETSVDFSSDVDMAENAIIKAAGRNTGGNSGNTAHPTLYRPPYGSLSQTMTDVLKAKGYRTILWDIDTDDWDAEHISTSNIIDRIRKGLKPGSIILLHDGRDTHINYPRQNTIDAIKPVIDGLRAEGYEFVTVTELMARLGIEDTTVR